jgi:hypothetical protein
LSICSISISVPRDATRVELRRRNNPTGLRRLSGPPAAIQTASRGLRPA